MHKEILLEQNETISIFKQLKYSVKYTFDKEKLTKVCYNKKIYNGISGDDFLRKI